MLITGARGTARHGNQSYIIRVKNKRSPGYSRRFISIRSLCRPFRTYGTLVISLRRD